MTNALDRKKLLSKLTRAFAAPAALALVLAACSPPAEEPDEPDIEKAEDDAEEAMDEAGDMAEEAVDEVEDVADEAEDEMDEEPEGEMAEDDTE